MSSSERGFHDLTDEQIDSMDLKPYQHVCGNTGNTHRGLCNACVWDEAYLVGYKAAVKNHDASGCPGIFLKGEAAEWDPEDLTSVVPADQDGRST